MLFLYFIQQLKLYLNQEVAPMFICSVLFCCLFFLLEAIEGEFNLTMI